jgi:hypothetical protein
MLSDFYGAFAPVSLTIFGLWMIVVQTRHAEWAKSTAHRRRAYAVSLHFAIPGLMGMLSLVDPESKMLWQVAFAVSAATGAAIIAYMELSPLPTPRTVGWRLQAWLSVLMYALVLLVALMPGAVEDIAAPLRIEAVLLSLIVFLGLNAAWALMFDEVPDAESDAESDVSAARPEAPHFQPQAPATRPDWYR